MNAIIDQKKQDDEKLTMAIICGYIRVWYDTDEEAHYELTEKGIKRLATLMVE